MPTLRKKIEVLCSPGQIRAVVQPLVRTADGYVVGYEALARMIPEPSRPPNWWLDAAAEIGLREDVELACLAAAASLGTPPSDRLLFVNLSPSTLVDPRAIAHLDALPPHLVVEITEQEAVADYGELRDHLAPWLSRGVRLAVDDTGAGYSSLRHVIELQPDFLKLDRELIREIHVDRNRQALVRAVVAFASEVGTSVVAEGVETAEELEVLRDAQVHIVQGFLLAKPSEPWPSVIRPSAATFEVGPHDRSQDLDPLRRALDLAADQKSACSAVVEHLFRRGQIMPSLYLESEGHLRCVAQRGLWQVLDGMPSSAGVTGRTWKEGRPIAIERVADDPDYLEAIPGVVSEMCVPIVIDGTPIGALNIESLSPIPRTMLHTLTRCADFVSERLRSIREHSPNTAWQRAARASIRMTGMSEGIGFSERIVDCVRTSAGMDSACLISIGREGPRVRSAIGPLAAELHALSAEDLTALSSLVGDIRSCYTAGDAVDRGFIGSDALREAGARAIVVLPLWARRQRFGSILLAHSKPVRLTGDDVQPLEMLADTAAAVLFEHSAQQPHGLDPIRSLLHPVP